MGHWVFLYGQTCLYSILHYGWYGAEQSMQNGKLHSLKKKFGSSFNLFLRATIAYSSCTKMH